jgi:Flp pilus assembly protein TadG
VTIPIQGDKVPKVGKRKDQELGQSVVEFALTLPLLLLLLLGTIDLGLGFKTYIGLTNAAREGARWVSIYPGDHEDALEFRIRPEAAQVGLSEGSYTVTFNYPAEDKVTVTVHHNYKPLSGILGLPHIPFEASATMAVLYGE